MAWFENFDSGWDRLKAKYGERFCRLWEYYLLYCAGSFRTRHIQLWQIVFSKHGVPGDIKRFGEVGTSFFLVVVIPLYLFLQLISRFKVSGPKGGYSMKYFEDLRLK